MKGLLQILLVALVALFFTACDTTSDSNESGANTITVTHGDGVDFSEGKNTSEWEKQDGYAVFWSPSNAYVEEEAYNEGVWYGNAASDGNSLYIYDAGEVALDSIKSVDESKWVQYNEPLHSLQVGHVYVVKARNGYAKFKVTAVVAPKSEDDTQNLSFSANYNYSSTTSFE